MSVPRALEVAALKYVQALCEPDWEEASILFRRVLSGVKSTDLRAYYDEVLRRVAMLLDESRLETCEALVQALAGVKDVARIEAICNEEWCRQMRWMAGRAAQLAADA